MWKSATSSGKGWNKKPLLSMVREVVFGVGFALLPLPFGLALPVSDVCTFVAAAFLLAKTYRQLSEKAPYPAIG